MNIGQYYQFKSVLLPNVYKVLEVDEEYVTVRPLFGYRLYTKDIKILKVKFEEAIPIKDYTAVRNNTML